MKLVSLIIWYIYGDVCIPFIFFKKNPNNHLDGCFHAFKCVQMQ